MGYGVGLIGAGLIAGLHLDALKASPYVDFVDIAEESEALLAQRKAEYGDLIRFTTTNYQDLLAKDELQVVDITVPHYLHYPVCKAAFEAGKQVIMEKPITIELEHGVELCRLARDKGLRFYVSMNQRLMPAHVKVAELLASGALGKPYLALFNLMGYDPRMLDADSWKGDWEKAGGGGLIDTGFHGAYLLKGFLGPVKSVQAVTKRTLSNLESKADDIAVAIWEHESGAISELAVCYAVKTDPWYETRRIYCEEASLHFDDDPIRPLKIGRGGQYEWVEGLEAPQGTFAQSVSTSVALGLEALATGGAFPSEPEESVEVHVIGGHPLLGKWSPAQAPGPMTYLGQKRYRIQLELPKGSVLEYKYIQRKKDQTVWELGLENRYLQVPYEGSIRINDQWERKGH